MKVTMLGASRSGKTTYMAAMKTLFYDQPKEDFLLVANTNKRQSEELVYVHFDELSCLAEGRFPNATATDSTIMELTLTRGRSDVLDLSWVDYRGRAIEELARGSRTESTSRLETYLLSSDVIFVFADAELLKTIDNVPLLISKSGINSAPVVEMLNRIYSKNCPSIIFLLSKCDSDLVNIANDYYLLRNRLNMAYARFFSNNRTSIERFSVIPIGCVGAGRVHTDTTNGNYIDRITRPGIVPINVDVSFAYALELCRKREVAELDRTIRAQTAALDQIVFRYPILSKLVDTLFYGSRKQEQQWELQQMLGEKRLEKERLNVHKEALERIWSKGLQYVR